MARMDWILMIVIVVETYTVLVRRGCQALDIEKEMSMPPALKAFRWCDKGKSYLVVVGISSSGLLVLIFSFSVCVHMYNSCLFGMNVIVLIFCLFHPKPLFTVHISTMNTHPSIAGLQQNKEY